MEGSEGRSLTFLYDLSPSIWLSFLFIGNELFLKEPLFPPTFSQLISVGEQTGQLDEMFGSVAMYYEEEFDGAVDNMSSLIEPIMIVFMGLMIGGLMIAMYSPIFNVGALIG